MKHAVLSTDGGSRGNPGTSGIGFVLTLDDGRIYRGGSYIGETSNNVAEYNALIWGLENAKAAAIDDLDVHADSELMVNQINGIYRVKSEGLKPLFAQARMLASGFASFNISHVYREANKEADMLVNEAMDKKATIGDFLRKPTQKQSLFDLMSAPDVTDPDPVLPVPQAPAGIMVQGRELSQEGEVALAAVPVEAGVYELTVKSHFDAAHSLVGYPGQCAHLHGHTWDVEVSVEGTLLDSIGILYDLKQLKSDLNGILEEFDHTYLNDLPVFTDMNSTAENMARVIYERMEALLPEHVAVVDVCVWESPVARLRYRKR